MSASAKQNSDSLLFKAIESQILADITKIHPTANINIAFNLPNTHKKYAKCKNFSLPNVKKISSGGRISLRLSCKQPKWSTYITFKVSIVYLVATAKMHIVKGDKFTSSNVQFIAKDITKVHRSYFTAPDPLIGKTAKRVIKQSEVLNPFMLDSPILINKDDSVIIQAGIGGLTISTMGTALQNGKMGRKIRVKNCRSVKIIRAYVTGVGKVKTTAE
jgi:flagella basal body P-ring formation protein FlgA